MSALQKKCKVLEDGRVPDLEGRGGRAGAKAGLKPYPLRLSSRARPHCHMRLFSSLKSVQEIDRNECHTGNRAPTKRRAGEGGPGGHS